MPNIIKAVFTGGSVGAIKGNAFIGGTPLQTNKNIGTVPAGVNTNYTWNSIPYLSSLPIQICGFNRLMACTSNDCRDKPQLKCYFNPVFGNIGTNGPSYQNDVSSFFIRWAGYTPSFIIQRSTQKYFNPNGRDFGNWDNVVTISNNNYGTYYGVGQVPFNPTWAGVEIDWGKILHDFGVGIYRVSVQNVTITQTQPTATITISNSGFPQTVTGTFTVGSLVFAVNYTGSYSGYLNYLAALINTQISYSATVTSTGLIITGTNGNQQNGQTISSLLTYSGSTFKAQMSSGGPPNGDQGGLIETYSSSPVNVILKNPMTFHLSSAPYGYNNDSCYSANSSFTCGNVPVQTFSGSLEWLATGTNLDVSDYTITMYLMKNGVQIDAVSPVSLAFSNSSPGGTTTFSFRPTNGIGGNPAPLLPGDVITIKIGLYSTWTRRTGAWTLGVLILANSTWWKNTPIKTVKTIYGILSGGTAPTPNYQCAFASYPYILNLWDCDKARGSVKFESNMSGTPSDAFNPGQLFNLNGFTIYDSIRVPGFFGNMEPKFDKLINEWGPSLSHPFGYIELVRDKIVENMKFTSKQIPYFIYKTLLYYAFRSPELLVSDYNTVNANWDIKQQRFLLKGDVKPKYYNKSGFNTSRNDLNRRVVIEAMFEDGIQGGIWSSVDV